MGLDYEVASAQAQYYKGSNSNLFKRVFDKIDLHPELLVIDEESLQKMTDIQIRYKK